MFKKYVPPTKFCVFPALNYWEIDEKPASSREAGYGAHPRAILRETEISKNIHEYLGYII